MLVDKALIGAVVGVGEEGCPARRQAACLHCEAMVLRCDEAAPRVLVQAWLVVPTVPIPGVAGQMAVSPRAAGTPVWSPLPQNPAHFIL